MPPVTATLRLYPEAAGGGAAMPAAIGEDPARAAHWSTHDKEAEMAELPVPADGIVLTHFIVSRDPDRARRFYTDVLGGTAVRENRPAIVALANGWVIINVGGGPTEDKPEVTLQAPSDATRASAFLNIRVADIQRCYEEWSARGAEFLTPPMQRATEIRCYMRDPDGHLIEVGQSTADLGEPTEAHA